jgi:hypothetical protein
MSLGLMVNIVIHQLDKPRWEVCVCIFFCFFFHIFFLKIVNWPSSQKTIHLSYHNGEHYSSVRPREGNQLPSVSETKSDFTSSSSSSVERKKDVEVPSNVSPEVALVMAATDCGDVEMVRQTLVENLYDVQSAINYILLLQETNDNHSVVRSVQV